ncbi:MAG TPA: hypothetical protein VIH90_02100 [Candidatus Saccharimonadales bacterium]
MNQSFEGSQEVSEVAYTAAVIENQLRGGFLRDVAASKVDAIPELATVTDITEIVLPEPAPRPESGVVLEPRWALLVGNEAAAAVKAVNLANSDNILATAVNLGLRKLIDGQRLPEDVAKIDPERAIFVVEGGGNKTSVVRRGVAIKAMHELYGDDLSAVDLYQFGGGRAIDPVRTDQKPNAEHKTIRDLAGGFLPEGTFTEFEANLATALADGYEISESEDASDDGLIAQKYTLLHANAGLPRLILIQPTGPRLEEALDGIKSLLDNKQLVIATNGQYREKDLHQAEVWGESRGIDMLPVVSLGDEPGDSFQFAGGEIVVPDRAASVYINDLIVLWRLTTRRLPDNSIEV